MIADVEMLAQAFARKHWVKVDGGRAIRDKWLLCVWLDGRVGPAYLSGKEWMLPNGFHFIGVPTTPPAYFLDEVPLPDEIGPRAARIAQLESELRALREAS